MSAIGFGPSQIESYYSTHTRPSDGAIVTNRGQVIGAPHWTRSVLAEIHQRHDWAGIPRAGEWDWPEVPECAR